MNQPKGITALTLTLLGYAVGMARQYIVSPSPLAAHHPRGPWPDRSAGSSSTRSCRSCSGSFDGSAATGSRVALLTALYSAVLTPIVYPRPPADPRGLPAAEGGAVLDGAVVLAAAGARDPRGADVRRRSRPGCGSCRCSPAASPYEARPSDSMRFVYTDRDAADASSTRAERPVVLNQQSARGPRHPATAGRRGGGRVCCGSPTSSGCPSPELREGLDSTATTTTRRSRSPYDVDEGRVELYI